MRETRIQGLLAACALGLAACVTAVPQETEAPQQRAVADLNTPSIKGERDEGGYLEPGIQVLSQDGGMSDAAVGRAIANKLRANLVFPRGSSYPKNLAVTLEALLTSNGKVIGARVARSSGHKAVDEAVLKALRRAEPLPVTQAMREQDQSQRLTLVFHPFQ